MLLNPLFSLGKNGEEYLYGTKISQKRLTKPPKQSYIQILKALLSKHKIPLHVLPFNLKHISQRRRRNHSQYATLVWDFVLFFTFLMISVIDIFFSFCFVLYGLAIDRFCIGILRCKAVYKNIHTRVQRFFESFFFVVTATFVKRNFKLEKRQCFV